MAPDQALPPFVPLPTLPPEQQAEEQGMVLVEFEQPFHQLHYEISYCVEVFGTPNHVDMGTRAHVEQFALVTLAALEPKPCGFSACHLALPHEAVDIEVQCKEPGYVLELLAARGATRGLGVAPTPMGTVVTAQRASGLPVHVWLSPRSPRWSAFLQRALLRFPVARPLFLFLKLFCLHHGLLRSGYAEGADRGGKLEPMALFCTVVGFLLHHRSVTYPPLRCCTYLGHLVADFFKVYGTEFAYEKLGLSLRRGSFFNKKDQGYTKQLCVESPVGPRADIGVSDFSSGVAAFAQAYEMISSLVAARRPVRIFPWLLDGEHVMMQRPLAPGEQSLERRHDVADCDDEI